MLRFIGLALMIISMLNTLCVCFRIYGRDYESEGKFLGFSTVLVIVGFILLLAHIVVT